MHSALARCVVLFLSFAACGPDRAPSTKPFSWTGVYVGELTPSGTCRFATDKFSARFTVAENNSIAFGGTTCANGILSSSGPSPGSAQPTYTANLAEVACQGFLLSGSLSSVGSDAVAVLSVREQAMTGSATCPFTDRDTCCKGGLSGTLVKQ